MTTLATLHAVVHVM